MKISIQGIKGAFHEEAARKYFNQNISPVENLSFSGVISSVEQEKADAGIMAIENSISGTIHANYELIKNSNLHIVGETYLRISQNLAVCKGVELQELSQVDLVLECTGVVTHSDHAELHLVQGAKRVLISHPAEAGVDATVIQGFNQQTLLAEHKIISNGSCSTNCLIPVLQVLHNQFGIESGMTTTIHSAMNDQPVIDAYHSDLRRTRAAVQSIIPVETGLARGIARLMPELANKFESLHMRVPTLNVSALDVTLQLQQAVTAGQVNSLLQQVAETELKGVLAFTQEPHASVDFNHDPHSGVVDGTQTRVSNGSLLKLMIWFDNEWGFANRMLDTALQLKNINA